jgi:repressor LexA
MLTIGERIRRRRKQLGLSVDDIAKKLGKDRATIYRYEKAMDKFTQYLGS